MLVLGCVLTKLHHISSNAKIFGTQPCIFGLHVEQLKEELKSRTMCEFLQFSLIETIENESNRYTLCLMSKSKGCFPTVCCFFAVWGGDELFPKIPVTSLVGNQQLTPILPAGN